MWLPPWLLNDTFLATTADLPLGKFEWNVASNQTLKSVFKIVMNEWSPQIVFFFSCHKYNAYYHLLIPWVTELTTK